MNIVMLRTADLIEPGATIRIAVWPLDSANIHNPISELGWILSQTAGTPGVIHTTQGTGNSLVKFTASQDSVIGETITIRATSEVDMMSTDVDIQVVHLIGSTLLSLEPQLPENFVLFATGSWSFDLYLTGPQQSLPLGILWSLDPGRLRLQLTLRDKVFNIPTLVQRVFPDLWRVHVLPSPIGEQVLVEYTENVHLERQGQRAIALLRRHAARIHSVAVLHDGARLERVSGPQWNHEPQADFIQMGDAISDRLITGQISRVQVVYEAHDTSQLAGWYVDTGLGPHESESAVLHMSYGPQDIAAQAEQSAQDNQLITRAKASVPVTLSGSLKVKPYRHVWLRQQDEALLRESYAGVMLE